MTDVTIMLGRTVVHCGSEVTALMFLRRYVGDSPEAFIRRRAAMRVVEQAEAEFPRPTPKPRRRRAPKAELVQEQPEPEAIDEDLEEQSEPEPAVEPEESDAGDDHEDEEHDDAPPAPPPDARLPDHPRLVLRAFQRDPECSFSRIAKEVFGDDGPRAMTKVGLLVSRLCERGLLSRVTPTRYRVVRDEAPIQAKRPGRRGRPPRPRDPEHELDEDAQHYGAGEDFGGRIPQAIDFD